MQQYYYYTKHKMHSTSREANVHNSASGQTDMINWFRNIHATSLNLKSKMVVQRKGRSHVTDIGNNSINSY